MNKLEFKKSIDWDGKLRTLYKKECLFCFSTYWIPKKELTRSRTCSRSCTNKLKTKEHTKEINCSFCNIKYTISISRLNNKSGLNFCTRKCKDLAQRREGIEGFSSGPVMTSGNSIFYRKLALRNFANKCFICNYNEDVRMLDVDHIDNNRKNNSLDNLQILCVWCHALKTRSKWGNKLEGN